MKATVTISIEVADLGDLERVEQLCKELTGGTPAQTTEATEEKPKRKRGRRTKAQIEADKKAAEEEQAAVAESEKVVAEVITDDDPLGLGLGGDEAEPEVTEADLRARINELVAEHGEDIAAPIAAVFQSAAGAAKFSDIKPKDFGAVLKGLEDVTP